MKREQYVCLVCGFNIIGFLRPKVGRHHTRERQSLRSPRSPQMKKIDIKGLKQAYEQQ